MAKITDNLVETLSRKEDILDFKNEKEFCRFIEENIDILFRDMFGEKVLSCSSEYYFTKGKRKFEGGNKPRVDFYIVTDKRKYIVEVKKPGKDLTSLVAGVSQIMGYAVLAQEKGLEYDELVIITNKHDKRINRMIEIFKLPIKVIVITKSFLIYN